MNWRIGYSRLSGEYELPAYYYYTQKIDSYTILIPLTYYFQYNLGSIDQISNLYKSILNDKLNPFTEIGLAWNIAGRGTGKSNASWDFFEWDFQYGFGFEYYINQKYAIEMRLTRHSIFTSYDIAYWNWKVCFNLY